MIIMELEENFLQKVTSAWEDESKAMWDNTQHLSMLRIGLVLAKDGGLLSQLSLPIKLFLGTAFASDQTQVFTILVIPSVVWQS